MKRQRVLATLAAAVVAVAAFAMPAGAAAPKKFKATRAIVVDKATGALRLPTPAEVDAVVTTLTVLGQQPADSLPSSAGPRGGVTMDLAGGFAGVLLARPNEDGTWETRCVFTVEEGAEFLGLVEEAL
jgi:hypothetical protein